MAVDWGIKSLALVVMALVVLSGCGGASTPVATVAPTQAPTLAPPTSAPSATPLSTATALTLVTVQAPELQAGASTPTPLPAVISATPIPPTPVSSTPVSSTSVTLLPTVTAAPPTLQATVVANTAESLPFAISMPPGFEIRYYAKNVPNARSLALGANGTIFAGSRSAGTVYALVDQNGDQQADQLYTIAGGLNSPNGVAFYNNALYVAEINRIIRFDNIEANLANPPAPVLITDQYPADALHGWKYLRFSPDGYLYVPVGVPCNDCEISGLYGTITRIRPDGTEMQVFAGGIRNTVGFDWNPLTQELWFTDNGVDTLGDDIPPDELNVASTAGLNFGFPYCQGGTIPDPQFGSQHSCSEFVAPAIALGPHVAALGMRFYTGAMFPAAYQNQVFIAEHGSQSRSSFIGYRVTLVRIENNQAVSYEPFAEGWQQNGQIFGRPVDILELPDGSLLVSDDTANAIYRISYQTP